MHLLVLSAFRRGGEGYEGCPAWSQCTFWCSVLSDRNPLIELKLRRFSLNAPFGAQCFPTPHELNIQREDGVSMHLLVLSAFRRH